jgi:hypothetical protein
VPPDEKYLLYLKHVEGRLFEKMKKAKCILLVFLSKYITTHGGENMKIPSVLFVERMSQIS